MAELKLQKRYKYAGDIMPKLLDIGFDLETASDFLNDIPDADVAPRAEVEKIIEEVKKKAEAYFWHQDSVATSWFIEFCDELKKKYAEGRNE